MDARTHHRGVEAMRITFRILMSSLFVIAWALPGTSLASAAGLNGTRVVKRPITFEVKNVNRSVLACPSDGATYEVKGHLIGPSSEVGPRASARPRSATLYLHDFSMGEFFWS